MPTNLQNRQYYRLLRNSLILEHHYLLNNWIGGHKKLILLGPCMVTSRTILEGKSTSFFLICEEVVYHNISRYETLPWLLWTLSDLSSQGREYKELESFYSIPGFLWHRAITSSTSSLLIIWRSSYRSYYIVSIWKTLQRSREFFCYLPSLLKSIHRLTEGIGIEKQKLLA